MRGRGKPPTRFAGFARPSEPMAENWQEQILSHLADGATISEAALLCGVSLGKVLAKARNENDWADRLRVASLEGCEKRLKKAEDLIERLAEGGNVKAALALFEHRQKERQRAAESVLQLGGPISVQPLGAVKTNGLPSGRSET